jgi:hypothetical protein
MDLGYMSEDEKAAQLEMLSATGHGEADALVAAVVEDPLSPAHLNAPVMLAVDTGLPRVQLTRRVGWSGRGSGEVECLVFDRCESSEAALSASAVVGAFDPGDDRQP